MDHLIAHLRRNLVIDFAGDLSVPRIGELLADDQSISAKALLAKIIADGDVDRMMLWMADRLLERVRQTLTDEVLREVLENYIDS